MKDLIQNIEQWAEARNIINGSTLQKQIFKLVEEVGELFSGHNKNNLDLIKDSVGDCVVVLVNLRKMLNYDETIYDTYLESDYIHQIPAEKFNADYSLGWMLRFTCQLSDCHLPEIVSVQSVIQFSKEYEKRVEESVQKNVAIQTAERELIIQQKQAEIVKVNAQAKADAEVIQAKADAEKVRLAGEAEAAAIRAKGEALKENRQLVELTAAEKWNGVLPTTMTPNGTVPFVQLGK